MGPGNLEEVGLVQGVGWHVLVLPWTRAMTSRLLYDVSAIAAQPCQPLPVSWSVVTSLWRAYRASAVK